MPWFRVDDSFHSHPKAIASGNEAVGLWVRCGTYAAEHLTDGFVPRDVVLLYGSTALAGTLVRTRLWHRARGGWTIHDYLDYNPSREAVENERQKAAERQRRHRSVTSARPELDLGNRGGQPVDNSRETDKKARSPTSQAITSRRDNAVTSTVTHTTPTRPDPYIRGTSLPVTERPSTADAGRPRYPNPLDGAAARHPSSRTVQEAIAESTRGNP